MSFCPGRNRLASMAGLAACNADSLTLYFRAMYAGVSPEAIVCVRDEGAGGFERLARLVRGRYGKTSLRAAIMVWVTRVGGSVGACTRFESVTPRFA